MKGKGGEGGRGGFFSSFLSLFRSITSFDIPPRAPMC